jgi:hypothetical protein
MLHLNIPARAESFLRIQLRKLKWLILTLIAPELVILFASGQWAAAKRSVADMSRLQVENWSKVHAFYAESGGFMLRM